MKRLSRFLFTLAVLGGAATGQWSCGDGIRSEAASSSEAPVTALQVKAVPVSIQDWAVTVPVSGSLASQSIVEIKSEVGGRLLNTHFEEGDSVRRGDLLAEIDPVNYQLAHNQALAALAVARAGLERSKVALDHARREKDRADNLLRTGGITEKDHQAAVTGVREAESQVRLSEAQCGQAEAAVRISEKSLADCRITAAAAGQVRKKFLDAGSLLGPGSPVYTLVDNSRLELECLLPSYRLAEVRIGQRVTFTTPTWGDRQFEGRVSAINPMVESDSRSVRVKVKVPNPKEELLSGMFARGEVEIRVQRGALVIPRSAMVAEESGSFSGVVYVVDGQLARSREVRAAGIRENLLWIDQGLAAGDQVIVEIGPSLRDGTPVRISTNP